MSQKIIDTIAKEIAEQLYNKLTSDYLQQISTKYNIPYQDLVDILNGTQTIRATAIAVVKPTEASSKKSSIDIEHLKKKVSDAKNSGRYYNVSTKNFITDTKANRSKLLFNDQLFIVGKKDEQDLFDRCAKLLGDNTSTTVTPVAVSSTTVAVSPTTVAVTPVTVSSTTVAVTPVKETTTDSGDSDSEDSVEAPVKNTKKIEAYESQEDESEINEKPTKVEKPIVNKEATDDESKEVKVEKAKPVAAVKKVNDIGKEKAKPVVVKEATDDENEEEAKPVAVSVKKVEKAKPVVVKEATDDESEESEEKPVAKPVSVAVKKANNEGKENTKLVEKKKDVELKTSSNEPKPGSKPKLSFHDNLKKWWNQNTGFIIEKQGFDCIIVGKIVDNKITSLSSADVKQCETLGWKYRAKNIKDDTSAATDDSSE